MGDGWGNFRGLPGAGVGCELLPERCSWRSSALLSEGASAWLPFI